MKHATILSGIAAILLACSIAPTFAIEHPFLIVKESDYAMLQARAAQSPWKEMKASAKSYAHSLTYDTAAGDYDKVKNIRSIVNFCALTYVLDPSQRTYCRDKILDTLLRRGSSGNWTAGSATDYMESGSWGERVPTSGAFFQSVVALDIIYNDLTSSDLSSVESALQPVANWYRRNDSWPHDTWGARLIWAMYKDNSDISWAVSGFRSEINENISPGGTYVAGSTYGIGRLIATTHRAAKTFPMDVMELNGLDTYYSCRRMQDFFEWCYGFGVNPFVRATTLGIPLRPVI